MDLARWLAPVPLVALGLAAAAAAVLGWRLGRTDGTARGRALEGAGLAMLGGLLATSLVGAVLSLGDDDAATGLFVGWCFFFLPGLLDTVLALFGVRVFTQPGVLLALALVVGTFTGGTHGAWAVYDWRRRGPWQALADVTWNLSGSTTGGILHGVNLAIGRRAPDRRLGASRFDPGFHVPGKPTFAFTQGAVMSNCRQAPGEPLYVHERFHVFQGRAFGPLFTITYLGWMVVAFVPSVVAGAVRKQPLSRVEPICYYSNPWEVWAYEVHRKARAEPAGADVRTRLSDHRCLREPTAYALGIPYLVAVGILLVVLGVLAVG
jgi:hypothetical protein